MEVSVPFLHKSGDVKDRAVDAGRFRRRARGALLREFVAMSEARRRVGTHAALGRSEITGTNAKMYRQKGTGNARHGARKAPQLRGGGMAFAKKPRTYGWQMPRKARRAALEAALRGKLDDGEVRIVESFDLAQPRTKDFVQLLKRLEIDGSFLVCPAAHDENVWRSCRNIPGSGYRVVSDLNAYEVLKSRYLILEEAALKALEERFGNGQ
ncbi:MAG: 50S ribosomal protein L4 [Planctomycetota bacterium]|jgi:large subunit ribosomal protein L4